MTRLQRTIAVLATLLAVVSAGIVFAAPASADTCQTRTWLQSTSRPLNMTWMPNIAGGIHRWGHFVGSRCRNSISWDPSGHAFDRTGDVEFRVRFYNSRGHTLSVTGWVMTYGDNYPTVRLAALTAGREFSIEGRNVMTLYRQEPYHYLGQIEF